MSNLLKDYIGLVNKEIPVNSDWDDELNEISDIRQSLHEQKDNFNADVIAAIDARWQEQITKTTGWDEGFTYPREGLPKSHWWAWIDIFDQLSEEERKTI